MDGLQLEEFHGYIRRAIQALEAAHEVTNAKSTNPQVSAYFHASTKVASAAVTQVAGDLTDYERSEGIIHTPHASRNAGRANRD